MKRVIALVLTAALLGACSDDKSAPSSSSSALTGSITVYAAASLTDSFEAIAAAFETAYPGTDVKFSFGGSSTLATQINNGAPADVFASASESAMKAVKDAVSPAVFVRNTMEIAVPPDNPALISTLADVTRPGVKVAVCQPDVPCGAAALAVFQKATLSFTPTTREADVKATLGKVILGEVDAGIVYVTDVRAAAGKVLGIPIPAEANVSTSYPITTLTDARSKALAQAFVDYVRSPAGQSVLLAAGFSAP